MNDEYGEQGAYVISYVEGHYGSQELNTYIQKAKENAAGIEGKIYVLGKVGRDNLRYTYGYLEDKYNLAYIPLEEGRLPENDNEIAVDRNVLNNWGWIGKVGNTIVLDDGKEYTVSGIIDEKYGIHRRTEFNGSIYEFLSYGFKGLEEIKCFPLIYCNRSNKESLYVINMLGGKDDYSDASQSSKEDENLILKFGDDYHQSFFQRNYHFASASSAASKSLEFDADTRWILIIVTIATFVAVLSMLSILFVVKKEKENNYGILLKIGMKKRRLFVLDAMECLLVSALEALAGLCIGTLVYSYILQFQKKYLDMNGGSGFSKDINVTRTTHSPVLTALVFTVCATIVTYLAASLILYLQKKYRGKNRKSNRSLILSMHGIFTNKLVTFIQFTSLYLACLGTLLGYIYFTTDNKEYHNGLPLYKFDINEYILPNGFDMEKDKIAEYYITDGPGIIRSECDSGYGFASAWYDFSAGIDDSIADEVSKDAYMIGTIDQTMVITDDIRRGFDYQIDINDEAKETLKNNSKPEYQAFFDETASEKILNYMPVRLLNRGTIEKLDACVSSGKIDLKKIDSGEEIILATSATALFEAGEEMEIVSALGNEYGIGIDELSDKKVKIGAVISVTPGDGKLLYYAAKINQISTYLVTTVAGAKAIGLHNAAYTEIMSEKAVDGGKIPKTAEMSFTSREKIRHDEFMKKMTEVGGIIVVVITMLIIGLAAYFGSIGLKIRNKAYEISVLRLLGESAVKIKTHIIMSVIWIPFAACLLAGGTTKLVQKKVLSDYDLYIKKYHSVALNIGSIEQQETLDKEAEEFSRNHFLPACLWDAHISKILLYIFIFVFAASVIGVFMALKKYRLKIIENVNKERKRE